MPLRRSSLLALGALAACGPSIRITRDGSVPLPASARYAWGRVDGPPSLAEQNPRAADPALRSLIERNIDSVLQRKGYVRTRSDSADVLVHFHLGVLTRVDTLREPREDCSTPPCPPYVWGYWGRSEERGGREVTVQDGSLMIDVMHRATGALAWRGLAEGDATPSASAAERERRVTKGVVRLLRDFPGR
ncbi:MAG: DUF4136 domain-containing protein [Gemmatimonadaceae bacterium]|jgi:hypothetical protein|nr:DUF4136 domain-containing protein [Gemmatimonadaceae bacterium]